MADVKPIGSITKATTVNSTDYITILDKDGQPFKILKSDFETAIADAMSSKTRTYLETLKKVPTMQYSGGYATSLYVRVCVINNATNGEGVSQNVSMFVSGGNPYTEWCFVGLLVANMHRKFVRISMKNLSVAADITFGYVTVGDKIEIWAITNVYRHPLSVIALCYAGASFDQATSNEIPTGWTTIAIS